MLPIGAKGLLTRARDYAKIVGMFKSLVLLALLPLLPLSSFSAEGNGAEFSEAPSSQVSPHHLLHDEADDVSYRDDVPVLVNHYLLPDKRVFSSVYSDEIFFRSTYEYHHLLARQSCGLAIAAFNVAEKEDEENQPGALPDYFRSIGFGTVRYDDYDKETSMFTVGSAIAAKDIFFEGEKARVIAVAIRGDKYDNEWESNFTLGDEARHKGFGQAASLVIDRVLSYYTTYPSTLPTKFWITGFSRAAAIANLVAAELGHVLEKEKDNIFAYTFATPAVIQAEEAGAEQGFGYIYNILGCADVIPQFVPKQWGFSRYGIDCWMNGAETDSTFDYKYQTIQKRLGGLGATTHYVPELNFRLRMFYGLLLEFSVDQEAFVELLQPVFVSVMQSHDVNSILELMRDTLIRYDTFSSATAAQKDVIIDAALAMIQPVLTGTGFMSGKQSSTAIPLMGLVHEHLPEIYLYKLYSLEEKDLFAKPDAYDCVLLDNNAYRLIDLDAKQELLRVEGGAKTLSDYAISTHRDYAIFESTNRPVLVLPHDGHYALEYSLSEGASLSASVIPFGPYYVSHLSKYRLEIGPSGAREGTLVTVNEGQATYMGELVSTTPSQINDELGIGRLYMSYHVYVFLLGLAVGLLLVALLWLFALIYKLISKKKLRIGRLAILSLLILAAVEGETMFWFSSNLLLYNVLFKLVAAICVLALYLLGKRLKDFKRIDKTVLPALLLFSASYVLASVHVITSLSLAFAGAVYLIVYHLREEKMKPHQWLIYVLSMVFGLPLAMVFVGFASPDAIVYLCFVPAMVLVGFSVLAFPGRRHGACFLWIAAMGALGVYLFSNPNIFIASILYVAFMGLALVLFAISYDVPPSSEPALEPIGVEVKEQ